MVTEGHWKMMMLLIDKRMKMDDHVYMYEMYERVM